MKALSRNTHPVAKRPVKILQFGEGNFLRAFVDNFIQELNNQNLIDANVAVVQPVPFGRVKDLESQDGLYTLFLEGIKEGKIVKEHQIIDVISDFINPYADFNKYLNYAKNSDLEIIISNTTEAGIVYLEENILDGQTPNSFPGKLLRFLLERYNHFNGDAKVGLEIVPCELIDYNGDTLKEIMIKLAHFNNLSEQFINWLTTQNRFYNTLVDRIVPGYPKDEASDLEAKLGYTDSSMVKGEVFHLWVIEGPKELQSKLPFAKSGLNVHYVDSIVPYKQRKVKILNGSHTALVPVAYLLGLRAVKESIENPIIAKFVKGFIYDEVVPTINLPSADMHAFAFSVVERYSNPFVHHLLMSIALNSVSKFKSRILPTILDLKAENIFASHSFFSLAALIVFYRGYDLAGNVIELNDDKQFLDLFKELWATNDVNRVVKSVLALPFWETDYLLNGQVVDFVTKAANEIINNGVAAALATLLEVK